MDDSYTDWMFTLDKEYKGLNVGASISSQLISMKKEQSGLQTMVTSLVKIVG
jgi:hypothetical protein